LEGGAWPSGVGLPEGWPVEAHAVPDDSFRVAVAPRIALEPLAAVIAQDAPPTADAAPPPAEPAVKRGNKITPGFGVSTGNTENFNANALALFVRTTDGDKLTIDGNYFYGTAEGDKNTNKGTAGVTYDWFIKETPWFLWIDGRYEYDEFKTWRHRVSS